MHSEKKGAVESSDLNYSNRFVYLLVIAACAVGFGNVWRFPYLVYENGGILFIIIYLFIILFVALPLLILELGLGQVLRGSQIQCWSRFGDRSRANGLAFWVSFTICHFYQMLLAWSMVFLISSFTTEFGWANNKDWAAICDSQLDSSTCLHFNYCQWRGKECAVDALHNSKEFFRNRLNVYNDFSGRDQTMSFQRFSFWIYLSLAFTWIAVFLCLIGGPKIMGLTTYVTMGIPMILMIVLVILTATFDGASVGIKSYIGEVNLKKFKMSSIVDALTQSLFSLSIGQGVLATLASSSKPGDNFVESAVVSATTDTIFSIISGFAIFSMLGFLSVKSKLPISQLPASGILLAFTTYPAAVAELPKGVATLVAILFFFMLWSLGFSTLCTLAEALIRPLVNSSYGQSVNLKNWQATAIVCLYFIIIPAPIYSTNLGFSLVDLSDYFSAIAQTITAGLQVACLGYVYLYQYKLLKCGRKAYTVHTLTFFIGSLCLGAFSHVNIAACIILGIGLPLAGFISAVYLYDDNNNIKVPVADRVYYLTIYNVEALRRSFNKSFDARAKIRLPVLWSYCIKYIIPYVAFALAAQRLTNGYEIVNQPTVKAHYPWYVFILSVISPVAMICAIIYVFIRPNSISYLLPPKVDLSVYGEGAIDNKKEPMLLAKDYVHSHELSGVARTV